MFGDVGTRGLFYHLVGFVAYKKFGLQLGAVGVRLGISSMLFGVSLVRYLEMRKF